MNEQRSRTDERCRPTSFFHEHAWRERKKQRNLVPFLQKACLRRYVCSHIQCFQLYSPFLFFIVIAFVELFKFLQLPHSRWLRRWSVLFCHLILWGRASENGMAAERREESPANTCLKAFGQTLPLGSLLQLPLLKEHPSMMAVGYEV